MKENQRNSEAMWYYYQGRFVKTFLPKCPPIGFFWVIFGKYDNFQKNMRICKNCHIFIWQFEYDNYFENFENMTICNMTIFFLNVRNMTIFIFWIFEEVKFFMSTGISSWTGETTLRFGT